MRKISAIAVLALLTSCGVPSSSTPPDTPPSAPANLNGNEVGKPLEMGRSGCERTLKKQLTDPDSLQEDAYVITAASPTNWTARMSFRSRNGFGGMVPGVAVCTFDGVMYRVFTQG